MNSVNHFVAAFLLIVALFSPLLAQQNQPQRVSGVFAKLKVGQLVSVKEMNERFSITVIDGDQMLPQPHTIIELGSDHLVVQDFTALNELRIPLTSVKSVTHFKGFERN